MDDHLMLIGMMGSGKTTVGRMLAKRLGRVFHDSDEEIRTKTGKTVAEIFHERGVSAFRAEEKAVLGCALSSSPPAVIAIAGGAVLDPDSRRRIRQSGAVIWLRGAPSLLVQRAVSGTHRPLLDADPVGTMKLLDAVRHVVYADLADAIVDADRAAPAVVAERAEHAARALLQRILLEKALREGAWP